MKNTRQNGIYRKRKDLYEGRFEKGRDENGTIIYGSVYGKTRLEARQKRDEAIRNLGTVSVTKVDSKTTVAEAAMKFLNDNRHRLKPSTIAKYEMYTENYLARYFGDVKVGRMTKQRVLNFINAVTKDPNNEGKKIGNTLSYVLSFMRTALRDYVLVDCFDIKIKKDPPKKVNFFSEEQQGKLLETAKDMEQIYYLVVLLCVFLGLRIGELAGLKWSDFDFEKRTVHIQRTCQRVKNYSNDPNKKGKTEVLFTTPKSKTSDRFIPLPDFLVDILNSIPHKTEFVISQNGRFVEPRTIQNWWKKILKQAGLEATNFHTTRHTFAVRALENGFDAKTLSEVLGHSNSTTTMNLYAHCTNKHKVECMNRLYVVYCGMENGNGNQQVAG